MCGAARSARPPSSRSSGGVPSRIRSRCRTGWRRVADVVDQRALSAVARLVSLSSVRNSASFGSSSPWTLALRQPACPLEQAVGALAGVANSFRSPARALARGPSSVLDRRSAVSLEADGFAALAPVAARNVGIAVVHQPGGTRFGIARCPAPRRPAPGSCALVPRRRWG
jgi:hypothetical protein